MRLKKKHGIVALLFVSFCLKGMEFTASFSTKNPNFNLKEFLYPSAPLIPVQVLQNLLANKSSKEKKDPAMGVQLLMQLSNILLRKNNPRVSTLESNYPIHSLSCTLSSSKIILGFEGGECLLGDCSALKYAEKFFVGTQLPVVCFHPTHSQVAVSGEKDVLHILDVSLENCVQDFKHPASIKKIIFNQDGSKIATAAHDNRVYIWDINSNKGTKILEHKRAIEALSFSSMYLNLLMTGGADKRVRIWNIENGQRLARISFEGQVKSIANSPCGTLLAIGDTQNILSIWHLDKTSVKLFKEKKLEGWISSLNFHPSGHLLVAGVDGGKIEIIDTNNWAIVKSIVLTQATGRIQSSFALNGSSLMAAFGHSLKIFTFIDQKTITAFMKLNLTKQLAVVYAAQGLLDKKLIPKEVKKLLKSLPKKIKKIIDIAVEK